MTSRARGMHRALFTSVPIHGSIVRSPRPRDSPGPGDAVPRTPRDRVTGADTTLDQATRRR